MVYNKFMRQGALVWLRAHIGLLLLIGFLSWITLTTLQPGLFLIGWDNYSSYLGGFDGIFRTLFSTWRSYRGIGVPGDSESTDVFRQVLLLALSPVVPDAMRDQVYIMACLWLGVLAVYVLVTRLIRRHTATGDTVTDMAAAMAGMAYVLNLNTVSTFYFPIITYITRCAAIPLLLLVFDRFTYDRPLRPVTIVGFIVAVLFSSGSFITATVFFTTVLLLSAYILFQGSWKRGAIAFFLFICLNAFWLVPFANYTIEKSASLRLAPVFIDTNEAQLNQPPQSYSLWKQLLLYPNFFNTRYKTVEGNTSVPLHPMTTYVDSQPGQWVLAIFPVAALLGMLLLFLKGKTYYRLWWIPAIYGAFSILSSQEQSPLGFIPALLNRIPYFQVVFRFGDTKFHPYISFAGSLAVGMLIVLTMDAVSRIRRAGVVVLMVSAVMFVVVPLGTVYRPYINGDFLPKYLFVKLPEAYRDIAAVINNDASQGRVLHLPYDPNLYWRSHTWGYMGSAFFQYLLKRPYLDKTFEPASLETTDMFLELSAIIRDANQTSGDGLAARADKLLAHLSRNNVAWVVFDDSVSPEMRIRNMRYWGTFNTTDAAVLLGKLETDRKITKAADVPIDLLPIAQIYEHQLGQHPQQPLDTHHLVLYRVNTLHPQVASLTQTAAVDTALTRVAGLGKGKEYIQSTRFSDVLLYPLLYKDAVITPSETGTVLEHPLVANGAEGVMNVASGSGSVVQVRAEKKGQDVFLRFYKMEAPGVNTQEFLTFLREVRVPVSLVPGVADVMEQPDDYFANWHVLGNKPYGGIRIMVDNTVLPVPALTGDQEYVVGSVLVTSSDPEVKVLRGKAGIPMDVRAFALTDMPNCFGDRIDGYEYGLEASVAGQATLVSRNGSTCMVYPLTPGKSVHAEIRLNYQATQLGGSADQPGNDGEVSRYVGSLPKPNLLSVCIGQADGTCLNTHQMLSLSEESSVIIPTEIRGEDFSYLRLAVVPVGQQNQTFTILDGTLTYFDTVQDFVVPVPNTPYTGGVSLASDSLSITMPYILSRGSYYGASHDGWFVANRPCETSGGFRTTRRLPAGMLSYISDCYNELSLPLPFDSSTAKLWSVSYSLFSGKYPQFLLGDPFAHYINQYLSLYQGYPSVPGMLSLQSPQQWYRPYGGDAVNRIITGATPEWSYVWVPPLTELTDTRTKSYTIHQDSKNTGIVGLFGANITEFPGSWQDVEIRAGEPEMSYVASTSVTYRDILPSLVAVAVHEPAGTGKHMLIHRVGFDREWAAYPDMWSMIFGINGVMPIRCNGTFACYEVPSDHGTWFLFYAPERLAMIGWLATIFTAAIFVYTRRSVSRNSSE